MPQSGIRRSKRRALPPQKRLLLVSLVAEQGQVGAAEYLGVSVQTIGSLAAGFRANGSTVELIERKLAELPGGSEP